QVFAMNGDGESSTAISASDNRVVGTVALGGGPEFTIADGKGNVFVNLEDKSELLRIDARALQVKDRWTVAPCAAPSSMAFDGMSGRLFLGCRNRVLAVVNKEDGKVVANYPIGEKVDASVFDDTRKMVFSSTGDGHVYVFGQENANKYTLAATVDTAPGSKTMGYDKRTGTIFVPVREQNSVSLWVLRPE